MTTTPLPPLPNGGYQITLPRLFTADQMQTYAAQARADLEAENQRLREVLRLIEHATAPTHDDGAYHENAYELARAALKDEK